MERKFEARPTFEDLATEGQLAVAELFEGRLSKNQPVNIAQAQDESEVKHTHHWIIEEPNGEFSTGCCKNCPAQREFRNRPPGDADLMTKSEHQLLGPGL